VVCTCRAADTHAALWLQEAWAPVFHEAEASRPAVAIERSVHARRRLVTALAKGLAHGVAATSGGDRAHLLVAIGQLAARLVVVLDLDVAPERFGAEGPAGAGLMRLAAAAALLDIGIRHDAALEPAAYMALALTVQDPLRPVRCCALCDFAS
jgi:hypothetical protein